ncbi:M1 family metallopeptidase [Sulfobacillus thermosulfidooxidans]|uniref:M1 family metallopeptidase n=1 Tax=Sulfobacillus thermosulfidooxidans TaxID=28034 RepID=UPI0006B42E8C|nr:M1 family metallopeptidase [Sulfobacillus thermosulfidooxidans]
MTENAQQYRLPRTVIPHRYQIEITPNLTTETFQGLLRVEVEISSETHSIIMNAVDLSLSDVVIMAKTGENYPGTVSYEPEYERVKLEFASLLTPGSWTLSLAFEGHLGHDLRGFYVTTVKQENGESVVIASTQCEATDARRIFPCWDEPDFKAVFAITLVVDADLTALSNAQEVSSVVDEAGKRHVQFADTIPMSTYLVALIVGPLELTDPEPGQRIPLRVAARPGFSSLTSYAQAQAVNALNFFEQYFDIPYPGDKLDHVAIPDFAAGAMENLGCITYREEALLIDPAHSSPMEKLQVVGTIAHETAHMWFGDMVTMRWWNGLWLNEAFATFMQLLATDSLHPEWDVWTNFGVHRSYAFKIDGLASTRPIEYPVISPADAQGMFDVLTYEKGASVLRMMEQYLSPDVFRQGVKAYLTRYRFANTETQDLWNSLEAVSGQPVRQVMESWVFQGGYPLVRAQWNEKNQEIVLSQKPFRYEGEGTGTWQVPVVLGIHTRTDDVAKPVLLGSKSISMTVPNDVEWIMVNRGGYGFYRVAYDESLWKRLMGALRQMTPLERLTLADDIWAEVLANEVPLSQAVQLWHTLVDEDEPDVWSLVSGHMMLVDHIADDSGQKALQALVNHVAGPLFQQLGWTAQEEEDIKMGRLRAQLVRILGTLGANEMVRSEAKARLDAHFQGHESLSPDLISAVVDVVASNGGEKEWESMYEHFKQATTPQDAERYLMALGKFPDPALMVRTFSLCLSPEVRIQDGLYAIGQGLHTRQVQETTWTLLEDHWDKVTAKFPSYMMHPVVYALPSIIDDSLAERTVQWFKAHPLPEMARQLEQTMELQRVHRNFAHRVKGHLASIVQ